MSDTIIEMMKQVPSRFLTEVTDTVFDVYAKSYEDVSAGYPPPEAKDILPYIRRVNLDRDLRLIAAKYREQGIIASAEKNHSKNCHHTEIRTKNLVFTASTVPERQQLFRKAIFRNTLARVNQPSLFSSLNHELSGDAYYGTILHCADPKDPRYPKFVDIGFPDKHCRHWVELLDLVEFCKIDVRQYLLDTPRKQLEPTLASLDLPSPSVEEEVVPDHAKPILKSVKKSEIQNKKD